MEISLTKGSQPPYPREGKLKKVNSSLLSLIKAFSRASQVGNS